MSKQRNLIALDWLMPVLKDVFGELNQLLQRHDAQPAWQLIGQKRLIKPLSPFSKKLYPRNILVKSAMR